MKRKYQFVAALLIVLFTVSMGLTTLYLRNGEAQEDGELKIVTSFYPMYIAAQNVIGEIPGITLQNLSEPQTGCLHDYQLTPEDMKLLSGADIFIVNGGGIETFLSDVAASYPKLAIINASGEVSLLGGVQHDHEAEEAHTHEEEHAEEEHAHEHGAEEENAHAWMSLSDHMTQLETITSQLCTLDAAHKTQYQENLAKYKEKMQPMLRKIEEMKENMQNEHVILLHEAYAYVARDLGLTVSYTLNLDEERQVSAGEVAQVIAAIRENNIRLVLAEELYGRDMGDTIERETDAKVVYLDTLVRGDYEKDSYIDGMKENIRILKEVLAQ